MQWLEHLHSEFRTDPAKHPLATPSGLIEIFSETIESFGYVDGQDIQCGSNRRSGSETRRAAGNRAGDQTPTCSSPTHSPGSRVRTFAVW